MYNYTIQQYIDRIERFIARQESIKVDELYELQFSTWICIDGTCVHQLFSASFYWKRFNQFQIDPSKILTNLKKHVILRT